MPYFDLARQYGLTAREIEVASQVATGLSDKEIAEGLCVSLSTVKKHIHNIYRKTGVSSRVQLLALAHELEKPANAS